MNREGTTFNWGVSSYVVVRTDLDAPSAKRHVIVDLRTLKQMTVSEDFVASCERKGYVTS